MMLSPWIPYLLLLLALIVDFLPLPSFQFFLPFSNPLRSLRHVCTLATFQILQTITSIGRHIAERITLSQRQMDGIGRDGRTNRRYETLKKGLSSLIRDRSACHGHMEGLIDG